MFSGVTCILLLAVTFASARVDKQRVKYTDCHERWLDGKREPGVYNIYPNTTEPVKVFCNFTDTASSIVIQRRVDHTVSFYRGWQDYKRGFGDPQGNYWAGLDLIHHLTNNGYSKLRIDLTNWSGKNRYTFYNNFIVGDESRFYQMTVSPAAKGDVIDDLAFNNGMRFATFDYYDPNQCAVQMKAGWWYNYCSYTLPNGVYYYNGPYIPSGSFYDGIFWKDWEGFNYSLKFISMTLYK